MNNWKTPKEAFMLSAKVKSDNYEKAHKELLEFVNGPLLDKVNQAIERGEYLAICEISSIFESDITTDDIRTFILDNIPFGYEVEVCTTKNTLVIQVSWHDQM